MNNMTILAFGASGEFAGLVVPELAKRGARVRALVHRQEEEEKARKQGAQEVVVGDLTDAASLAAALEGVGSVFYIAPAFLDHEAEVGQNVVEAAKQVGVRRFVFSSIIHPILSALVNHRAKAPVEEALLESGMEYVFLQPTLFFQTLAESWPKVLETGSLAEPWSNETRFSRVDYRDVAEVAAIALTEDRLTYGTYQLCAEGHLDRYDVAGLMSEVLGRKIEAVKLEPEKATGGSSNDQSSPLKQMFRWYDHSGLLGNALTLHAILGREPRTLRAYLEELAAEENTEK